MERELLVIVFTCQQFNTYILGRNFTVESDHKPLNMIHVKDLANVPSWLKRMLLQLQWYDLTIKFERGREILLAGIASRCPAKSSLESKLDVLGDYVAFNKDWIEKLRDTTCNDAILGTVYQLIQQGCWHQWRCVPWVTRRYWYLRDN